MAAGAVSLKNLTKREEVRKLEKELMRLIIIILQVCGNQYRFTTQGRNAERALVFHMPMQTLFRSNRIRHLCLCCLVL